MNFFSFLHLIGRVVSCVVLEWRNSLLTGCTISGVELNTNVVNINKLLGVSTCFVILYYFVLFFTLPISQYLFQYKKRKISQISGGWGGGEDLQPPLPRPPPVPRFLRAWMKAGYNLLHNIFRLFDGRVSFLLTTKETKGDYW